MRRSLHSAKAAWTLLLLVFCLSAHAQDYLYATGNPSFGVNIPIENGFINVANGNVHIELPLAQRPQRGDLQLNERLVYDSRIWQIVQGSGHSWQPTNVPNSMAGWRFVSGLETGSLAVSSSGDLFGPVDCPDGTSYDQGQWGYTWTDSNGTAHILDARWIEFTQAGCDQTDFPEPESQQGYATDSSGYSIQMSGVTNEPPSSITIFDADGNQVYPAVVDRFGNEWSSDANGNLVDDLGNTPVKTTTNGNQIYYDVLSFGGANSRYTVTTEQIGVSTAFGQSGVTPFSGTLTAIQSIQLPDGSSYSFTYDGYGEMNSMTLPSGGVVSLGYGNYEDSYQNQNRWLTSYSGGHGSLTFTPSVISQCSGSGQVGCEEQMTVTDAALNDTVYTLTLNNGAWNTTTDFYSGPKGSGTKLVSTTTGYDFSQTCTSGICSNAAYVTRQSDTTTLVDVGQQKQTLYGYNSQLGKVTSVKQWDFNASSPTIDTEYTYGGYDLTQAQVLDGSGNQVALTNYNFTGTATPTAGITGHGPANPGALPLPYLGSVVQWAGGGNSLTTSFTNDDTGTQLTSSGPNGQTTFGHDPTDAFVTGVTPPTPSSGVSLPQSATYDPNTGLLASTTDPNGSQTVYSSYDWAGRIGLIDYPDGGQMTASYYSPTQIGIYHSMSAGTSTSRQILLDAYGRESRVAVYNGQATNPWYQTDYCYDANGRLHFKSYVYQGAGFVQAQICSGAGDTYSYDALGRVIQILHGDGTFINHQYIGRATETTGVDGISRISQVDAFGRVTAVCEISSNSSMPGSSSPANCGLDISGTGFLTGYAYNLANHQATVTQGAQTRTFQTDPLGRPIFTQEPESGATSYGYGYNGTGLVVTRSRPQANQTSASVQTTTTTQYDTAGRIVNITYSDGITPNKTFVYDSAQGWGWEQGSSATNLKGRLAVMGAGSSSGDHTGALFSYDAMGRVTNMWECTPSICGTGSQASRPALAFTYDWAGNLTSEFDGASGMINYTRSPAGEVTSITNGSYTIGGSYSPGSNPLVSNVQNGPFGPVSYELANGLDVSLFYDGLGRLSGEYVCSGSFQANCAGGTAELYAFAINMYGWEVTEACSGPSGVCAFLGYDEFGRQTSSNFNSGQQTFGYTYDQYGNRWGQSAPQGGPSFSASFNAQTNQIVGYGYDAAGNMTYDGSHSYQYDAEGNLLGVDSGSTAAYVYDAMNRRVSQQTAEGTNEFMYDYAGRRTSTWIASINFGSEGRIYWDGSQIAFRSLDSTTYFEHQDWMGTERLRTDSTGAGAAVYTSYAFGDGSSQTVTSSGVNQDNAGFAQLDFDPETSTNHAQYRQYSPAQGRWMSPDPYSGSYDFNNPQSLNRYSYVRNNPLNFNDPTGLLTDGEYGGNGGSGCGLPCIIATAGVAALIGGLEDLFGGGPSFHGSLKPRPSDPGSFGESLGIPTSIPQGNWGLGMALNLPSEACEFGPCGAQPSYATGNVGVSGSYTLPFGLSLTAFAGLLCDTHLHCGFYWGGGAGAAVGAAASGGVQVGYSNGSSICAFGGPFTNYSGTFGAEASGTVDYFEGSGDAPGRTVRGGELTVGVGGGGSASATATGTSIRPIAGHKCVNGILQ